MLQVLPLKLGWRGEGLDKKATLYLRLKKITIFNNRQSQRLHKSLFSTETELDEDRLGPG